jgi:ABC-type multidrug transport system fused ATPase/permease subunit
MCPLPALPAAFSRGWDLTLVMMAGFPFMAGVGLSTSAMSRRMRQRASRSNSAASSAAQQALTNIRTVASYGLEARTMQQYESLLELPLQAGIKQGLLSGVTLGAASGESGRVHSLDFHA